MKKLRLLLLDANIVIKLFELGLWNVVVKKCEILLSRIVAETEVEFYENNGLREEIDLSPYIDQNLLTIVEVNTNDVWNFRNLFDPAYFDRLDPGETESLAYLLGSQDPCLISSADSIVFRVLGCLHRSDQGISLEEILQKIGYGRKLPYQYTKAFRVKWTKQGQQDGITDIGLKKS